MDLNYNSKQFGTTLFIIYIILIVPIIFMLTQTGSDLNKLAMNPNFATANEVKASFPALFFVVGFSFFIAIVAISSLFFYIRRNKLSIDFDETIDFETWRGEDSTTENQPSLAETQKELVAQNISSLKEKFNELKALPTHEEKSELAIKYLCKTLDAGFGIIYLTDTTENTDFLTYSAGYAFHKPKGDSSKILFGEGLTGQVAKSQRTIIIDQLNANGITIFSGLGNSSPKSLIITPIIKDNVTIGIIEIASFKKTTVYDKQLVETSAQILSSEY